MSQYDKKEEMRKCVGRIFSNYFNENSSTLFLKIAKLDKFVIDTG